MVNCLFSTSENWSVRLSRVKEFSDKNDLSVDDAKVAVVSESGDTIRLANSGKGIYSADVKPEFGKRYRLVITDHSKTITAENSIPGEIKVESFNLSTVPTKFFFNPNLIDYDVFPLNLQLTSANTSNLVRLKFYFFNSDLGYKRYSITSHTIYELRKNNMPEELIKEFESLLGISLGRYRYHDVIDGILGKYQIKDAFAMSNKINHTLEETQVNYRPDDAFVSNLIFANSNWLRNLSKDTHNVLGEFKSNAIADLFVSCYPGINKSYKIEYWLEVVGMSEDYYKYQETYIKQLINQNNPFSSPIEVHSNIKNGIGIFAGYNRQMVHLHDF